MKKVFLGGTCNGSSWRDDFIKHLKINYYRPDSDHWTPEMMEEEIQQRAECDFCLYVITPKILIDHQKIFFLHLIVNIRISFLKAACYCHPQLQL